MAFNRFSLYRTIRFEFIARCPRFVCANFAIRFSFLLLSASKQLSTGPIVASGLLRWMPDSHWEKRVVVEAHWRIAKRLQRASPVSPSTDFLNSGV